MPHRSCIKQIEKMMRLEVLDSVYRIVLFWFIINLYNWGAIQSDAAYTVDSNQNSNQKWMEGQLMATEKLSDEAFSAILTAHPGLRERFASIAHTVAGCDGDIKEADVIEEQLVDEMRLLGRVAMQGWAEHQVEVTEREIRLQPKMHRQGKKNSAGIQNSAKSWS